jgi:hypothetical protein
MVMSSAAAISTVRLLKLCEMSEAAALIRSAKTTNEICRLSPGRALKLVKRGLPKTQSFSFEERQREASHA